MLRVGLTGGIATGKSRVLEMFRRRGVPCLDADALAHGVTAAGTEATAAIAERFGAEILDDDGAVDRARLGPIVFGDPSARRDLEAIVHPGVYRAIASGLRGFELTGEYPFAVVDVPLLFETGHEEDFDRIIVTTCAPETQMARLIDRGMSREAAAERLAAQWRSEEKTSRADFVIRTDGALDDTDRQVEKAYRALQEEPDAMSLGRVRDGSDG
jgi:dephospho-CoA kinase